jgi:hypothetical protein
MTTPQWVPAGDVRAALGLSRHQLRMFVKRRGLTPGVHFLPGPTPNSPRRYSIPAIRQLLLQQAAQLRRDDGAVFPPPRRIEALQALAIDAENDRIELHDGSGEPPATAPLGGLRGLQAVLDLVGEIQRQGRRAAGQGRPLTDAHAVAPSLDLRAGIDADGCVVFTMAGRSLALPLCEVIDLQGAICRLLARGLKEEAGRRGQLEALLSDTPAVAEVRHG